MVYQHSQLGKRHPSRRHWPLSLAPRKQRKEDFGHAKRDWFQTFLDLSNGIPSLDTFNRIFSAIDPQKFLNVFLGLDPNRAPGRWNLDAFALFIQVAANSLFAYNSRKPQRLQRKAPIGIPSERSTFVPVQNDFFGGPSCQPPTRFAEC